MSRQTDKGNGFLKDKFGGFQADPPPEVWDAISNQLGGRRRRGLVIIVISAAASLALAVTLGIHYFGSEIPHEIELTQDQESDSFNQSGLERQVVEAIAEEVNTEGENDGRENAGQESEMVGNREFVLAVKGDTPESETEIAEAMVKDELTEIKEVMVKNELTEIAESTEEDELTEIAKALEKEEFAEIAKADELARTEEAKGDEKDVALILDAGNVGDVEVVGMMEDVVSQQEKDPRWVLGAMLSPLYSFRDAEPEALSGTSSEESGMMSYATGVQVGYRATRRLAFESGIIYNKMGLSIGASGIQVFARDNLDYAWAGPEMGSSPMTAITNSVGNIVSHSGDIFVNNYKLNAKTEDNSVDQAFTEVSNADQGIKQHLDYLELPFNLKYTLLDKSFKIQVLGGLSTNFLVNNYVTMETDAGTSEIGYLENIRNVNYSGNAGVGFVYHFLEQLSLNIEPRFRYYLNSVNDATLPSTRPYSFGIYTGLNYFF